MPKKNRCNHSGVAVLPEVAASTHQVVSTKKAPGAVVQNKQAQEHNINAPPFKMNYNYSSIRRNYMKRIWWDEEDDYNIQNVVEEAMRRFDVIKKLVVHRAEHESLEQKSKHVVLDSSTIASRATPSFEDAIIVKGGVKDAQDTTRTTTEDGNRLNVVGDESCSATKDEKRASNHSTVSCADDEEDTGTCSSQHSFHLLGKTVHFLRGRYVETITSVLTAGESRNIVDLASCIGFERALVKGANGRQKPDSQRNSERCIFESSQIAAILYRRLQIYLREAGMHQIKRDGGRNWVMDRLNPRLRILRYGPGQRFLPHLDESFSQTRPGDGLHERSFITVLVYLNDVNVDEEATTSCTAPSLRTSLYSSKSKRASPLSEGVHGATRFHGGTSKDFIDVLQDTGGVLMFEHDLKHEGRELAYGEKIVLRTEVMYIRKEDNSRVTKEDVLAANVELAKSFQDRSIRHITYARKELNGTTRKFMGYDVSSVLEG